MSPRILLAATSNWPTTARLAMSLDRAECAVEVVCPRGHPVTMTRAASRIYSYRPLSPLKSIRAAIEAARPDFVIPCDDLATAQLHRVYESTRGSGETSNALRALLEHSLGARFTFPVTEQRASLMALAREQGVRTPPTAVVRTPGELDDWLAQNGLPAVLKPDGTSCTRGVRIVHTSEEAGCALLAMSSPPSVARAIKRAMINRDWNYVLPCLRGTGSVVNVQRFVSGRDANITVACWKGNVLARITVTVLHTLEPNGPASVVRLIEHPEMVAAAERIVRRLKLSGLIGFDFVIEDRTGNAHLIEMNPRATQMGHLQLGPGRNLIGSMRVALTGAPAPEVASVTENAVIALFPQEWLRDSKSEFLRSAYHDVPWDEPALVTACLTEPLRSRAWAALNALMRSMHRRGGRPNRAYSASLKSSPGESWVGREQR